MSRRNRTSSNFHQRTHNDSFSKTSYMYPNQRHLGSTARKFGATKSTFFEERQRSLTNSVLDYQQQKMNTSTNGAAAKFTDKQYQQPHPNPKELHQRPTSGGRHPLKRSACVVDDENFRKTRPKLFNANFNHHDPDMCVCAYCTCGRHLCKLHVIKPDMHNSTTYQGDFNNKRPLHNLRFRPATGHYSKDPYVDLNSTYGKDFDGKNGPLERPHPDDCIGVGGPAANLTTYSSGFPGFRGDNQYVKPTNNTHLNGALPFHGNSIYRKSYLPKNGGPEDQARWTNHFKNGQPWLGNTTYRENFKGPNNDQYSSRVQVVQKRDIDPNFNHQYQTTYKNDFLDQGNRVCPAKVELESKVKGKFRQSKANFAQNADFKAMSPDFHAISTSRHSYV